MCHTVLYVRLKQEIAQEKNAVVGLVFKHQKLIGSLGKFTDDLFTIILGTHIKKVNGCNFDWHMVTVKVKKKYIYIISKYIYKTPGPLI